MNLNAFVALAESKPNLDLRRQLIRDEDFFKKPKGLTSRQHAKMIDGILGVNVPKIERNLVRKHCNYDKSYNGHRRDDYQEFQTWIGLDPQTLLTPYSDLMDIFDHLPLDKITRIIDFGAAYGRLGMVTAARLKDAAFIGYEIVSKRLQEGNRIFELLNLVQAQLLEQDITQEDFQIPEADVYFVYDFGSIDDLKILLSKLRDMASPREICLVARGEFIRNLIDTRYPDFTANHPPVKGNFWTIYRT